MECLLEKSVALLPWAPFPSVKHRRVLGVTHTLARGHICHTDPRLFSISAV